MHIRTALITAAGSGTRFFPVTKSVQKELLPILNRPVIDYLVDQCVEAGISRIIIVVRETSNLVEHFYTEQPAIREALEQLGSPEKYASIAHLHDKAEFIFIKQGYSEGYGTALPVKVAKDYLKDEEGFLYLTGDDIVEAFENPISALIDTAAKTKRAVVSGRVVPDSQVSRYGIIDYRQENGMRYLTKLLEKPLPEETESRLANVSKYVLPKSIFPIIESLKPDTKTGEYFLTDALVQLAEREKVAVHRFEATFLDCGSVGGWIRANLRMARKDEVLWGEIMAAIEELS